MNQKPEASDEEIERYMNFQGLMNKRAETLSLARRSSILKKSIGGLMIVAIAVSLVWLFKNNEGGNSTSPGQDPIASSQSIVPDETAVDSATISTEQQAPVETKEIVNPKQQPDKKESKGSKSKSDPDTQKKVAEESYVQAEPVSGYPDLYDYFNKNLVYPKEALKDSIQGVLTIAFVVNRDGRPEKIEIVNSLGEAFDREARRLVENMPDWKSAVLNGKPVPSRISLPVTFQIVKTKSH